MVGQEFRNAISSVTLGIFAIVPVKQFDLVVEVLLLIVDRHFDLDIMTAFFLRDGYSDVAHGYRFRYNHLSTEKMPRIIPFLDWNCWF